MTATTTAGAVTAPAAGRRIPAARIHLSAAGPRSTRMAPKLTDLQLRVLLAGLHGSRVGQTPKGFAHVQQWDVRRFLIRVFGFTGFDTELLEVRCVREIEHKPSNPEGKSRWTVVYLVHQRLTVKDVNGEIIGQYEGVATGDAQNQTGLGDAHDGAVKEADSQSLKRAAVNLGDAFGLSLYNGGSIEPVVKWTAVNPPKAADEGTPPAALDVPEDPPVKPEPGSDPEPDESAPPTPAPPTPQASAPAKAARQAAPAPAARPAKTEEDPADREAALSEMLDAAREIGFSEGVTGEFKKTFGHPIGQGTAAEYRQARDLMLGNSVAA